MQDSAKSVVLNALSMAFGTMSSRVLGLIRDRAFGALFDRTMTDAWTTAFRLPNMFRRLLGEGALSVSFIPVFVEARLEDPHGARSQNLVNGMYTLLLLILVTLTTLGILFPEPVLNLILDSAYKDIPGKFDMTVRMTRIMFAFVFLISTYAYFMGILNALGKYALAAFAPVLWNVAMIVSIFVPIRWLAHPGDAVSWGVVVGGFMQMAILVPTLIRYNYLPKWASVRASLRNPDIHRVFRRMLPGFVGLGLLQITTILNTSFASHLAEGAITHIYYADRLMELPLSLVSVSLGSALLPTLAQFWSQGNRLKMRETANYYLRLNLFIAVPAAIALRYLGEPIVEVLFKSGQFSAKDAEQTALVVGIYSVLIVFTSCVRVLVPSYYAIKNTWVPAVISGICLLVHWNIAPILMHQWGLSGLVYSSCLSSGLNLCLLMTGYHYFIGPLGMFKILKSTALFVGAGFGMYAGTMMYTPLLLLLNPNPLWIHRLIALGTTLTISALTYGVLAYVMKAEELRVTIDILIQKIRRKANRPIKKPPRGAT